MDKSSSFSTLLPIFVIFYLKIFAILLDRRASLVAQLVKNPPAMQEAWVQSMGWEDPLEKGKASHSSILAWRIPGLQRVREAQEYWSGYPIPSPADLLHPGMELGCTNWAIRETQKDRTDQLSLSTLFTHLYISII